MHFKINPAVSMTYTQCANYTLSHTIISRRLNILSRWIKDIRNL